MLCRAAGSQVTEKIHIYLLVEYHHSLVHSHLRGCQSNAIGRVHETQHLLGGLAYVSGEVCDGLVVLAQARVRVLEHWTNRQVGKGGEG